MSLINVGLQQQIFGVKLGRPIIWSSELTLLKAHWLHLHAGQKWCLSNLTYLYILLTRKMKTTTKKLNIENKVSFLISLGIWMYSCCFWKNYPIRKSPVFNLIIIWWWLEKQTCHSHYLAESSLNFTTSFSMLSPLLGHHYEPKFTCSDREDI